MDALFRSFDFLMMPCSPVSKLEAGKDHFYANAKQNSTLHHSVESGRNAGRHFAVFRWSREFNSRRREAKMRLRHAAAMQITARMN